MKTILVPLDGSALAEQVLPSVRMLAPILGAEVHLLHVVSEADRYHLLVDAAPADLFATQRERTLNSWETLRQQAESYLAPQAAQLRAAGVTTGFEIRLGSPAEVIVEVAEREHVVLIAMATHGYSGLKRWALGSIADKVVHATDTPIFLVRGEAQPPTGARALKRIMVPLDGSALSRQALPFATELATRTHAELIVLTALTPAIGEILSTTQFMRDDDTLGVARDRVMQEVGSVADELRRQDIPVTPLAVIDFPAEAIIDEAVRLHADLIVMATHGYGGLKRWALGSVADKVLHATTTPLVLVRAQASVK